LSASYVSDNNLIDVSIFVLPGVYQGEGNQNLTVNIETSLSFNKSNNNSSLVDVSFSIVAVDPSYGATTVLICLPSTWFIAFDLNSNSSSTAGDNSDNNNATSIATSYQLSGFTVYALNSSSCSAQATSTLELRLASSLSSHRDSVATKRDSMMTRLTTARKEFDSRLVTELQEEEEQQQQQQQRGGFNNTMGCTYRRDKERHYARVKARLKSLLMDRTTLIYHVNEIGSQLEALVMISSSSSSLPSWVTITNCSFEGEALALSIVATIANDSNSNNNSNNSNTVMNVVLQDSSFQSLTQSAVYASGDGVSVQVIGCLFENNTSDLSVGGALVIQNSASMNVTGSSFVGNLAPLGGGAISASANASLWIDSSLFSRNFAASSPTPSSYSTSSSLGGAVLVMNDASSEVLASTRVAINNSTFTNNYAMIGGAITNEGAELIVTSCLFEANEVLSFEDIRRRSLSLSLSLVSLSLVSLSPTMSSM